MKFSYLQVCATLNISTWGVIKQSKILTIQELLKSKFTEHLIQNLVYETGCNG